MWSSTKKMKEAPFRSNGSVLFGNSTGSTRDGAR